MHSSRSPPKTEKKGRNFGGMVGGSAAECTAVACCFPLAMVEMLFLGLYKVPAGLCKKAYARAKRNHKDQGLHPRPPKDQDPDLNRVVKGKQSGDIENDGLMGTVDSDKMLNQFPGTGFWRAPSETEAYTYDVTESRN
ncbi:hypothetical protein GQ457_12G027010 [Hibiscus cannabinus]